MREISETIRSLPYFAGLPDRILGEVAAGAELVDLEPGATIIEEGSDSEEMYVIVEGDLVVSKSTGGKEVELAHLGTGDVVGEMALLDGAQRTATVRASEKSKVIRVPVHAFEALLKDPAVVRRMFRTVTERLRDIEDTLRHEERMAALGRMAAQLMHELNNPAAAVTRSSKELIDVVSKLSDESGFIIGRTMDGASLPNPSPTGELSAFERADAENQLEEWLDSREVEDAWSLAPAMAEAGWSTVLLDEATAGLDDPEMTRHMVRWIGLKVAAAQLGSEVALGASRISELVRVVKDYSYLDQAPVQEVDVREGIQDTLLLLKGKLRDHEVELDFAPDLVKIEAPGRDLNQVWTNLIDNAAGAMTSGGSLAIAAHNIDQGIVVTVSDSGSGIADEVVDRIFDPFFTTKEPGEGTGLGLHTVHNIVNRLGGSISVASDAEGTRFTVRLPASTTT